MGVRTAATQLLVVVVHTRIVKDRPRRQGTSGGGKAKGEKLFNRGFHIFERHMQVGLLPGRSASVARRHRAY
jgi:hypothetical protein